jgi:hypothetical protein
MSRNLDDDIVRSAKIQHPKGMGESVLLAQFTEGGEYFRIFGFFNDELFFSEEEFIGKTLKQCEELRDKKDVAYLNS